jgi:serine protease Do
VPLKCDARVQVGDWVLKLGHPWGYRRDRPAVLRSGRIIAQNDDGFIADCPISPGDSGGPYFDLEGNLVGIIHSGSADLTDLLPKDQTTAQRCAGFNTLMTAVSSPLISSLLERMASGELPIPARDGSEDFGLARSIWLQRQEKAVPAGDWSQGGAVLAAFRPLVEPTAASVVTILNETVPVALGTVVGPDGWVLTKASELPPDPRCQLPNGTIATPRIVGVELAFDLALLQVQPATGLKRAVWSDTFTPEVGTFVAAVGPTGKPLAAGIVSVGRRNLAAVPEPKYKLPLTVRADYPEIRFLERAGSDQGYLVRRAIGRAFAAGIRKDDLIQTIDGRRVCTHQDLRDCMQGHRSGELVSVKLLRNGEAIDLTLPLHAVGDYSGANFRSDDFPTVFEHAAPVMPNECGGPLVDLSGRVVGITIARVGDHGCMAIPGDCIEQLIPDLQSGRLSGNWVPRRVAKQDRP